MIRALIFDLDGTLVDSAPGITQALNLALADFGLPSHSEKEVISFIGNGAARLVERALPKSHKHLTDQALVNFTNHYQSTWREGTPLFPGMMDLLQHLKREGYPMAVLSNKMHANTVEIIETLFPENLFHPVLGQRDGIPIKPDPTAALKIAQDWDLPPEEIAYVGDSEVDLTTARNAGMVPLIFSWGYGTPSDTPLLHRCGDLQKHLKPSASSS